MRIEQLEYVAAVTAHGSLRRASEALHISQPALSEAVTKLERELGLTLLDRRRSGSRISRRGTRPAPAHDRGPRVGRPAPPGGRRPGRARRGCCASAPSTPPRSTLLAPALRDLHAHHGSGGVEVINAQQAEIHQGLAEGTLDLGPGQRARRATTSRRDWSPASSSTASRSRACAPTTPWPRRDELTVDHLRAEPFVAMRPGLRDAPLRAPALRRHAAHHDLRHRRRRDGQGAGGRGPGHRDAARLLDLGRPARDAPA